MTGQGWINGSDIRTRPPTKEYREGWDRIFGKKVRPLIFDPEHYPEDAEALEKQKKINGNRP